MKKRILAGNAAMSLVLVMGVTAYAASNGTEFRESISMKGKDNTVFYLNETDTSGPRMVSAVKKKSL